jgi:hypothetical protein
MPRYRLKSGKLHTRINGKRVTFHAGAIINLEFSQARGFKDSLEPLDPELPDPAPPQPKLGLKAVHRGRGRYDVVNELTGVKINDEMLSKEEAQALATTAVIEEEKPDEENEEPPAGDV